MKAKERIERYGISAYLKMRGLKFTPSHIKFYIEKYEKALIKVEPPSKGRISRRMLSYWKDVKLIMKGRKWGVTETRKVMKKEGAGKDVTLRVIKKGEGWQLLLWGDYENPKVKKELIEYAWKHKINVDEYLKKEKSLWRAENVESYSYVHSEKDYNECLNECIRMAQGFLGGSNWELIKVLKYHWNRYYGREASISEDNS